MKRWIRCFTAVEGFLSNRGQSFLETALFLPILLLFVAGTIEVGVYALKYMSVLDASREAARFGSNLDPALTAKYPLDMHGAPFPDVRLMSTAELHSVCNNGESTNFYYEVACLAIQNISSGTLKMEAGDDIVITVIGVKDGQLKHRWPTRDQGHPNDLDYHFQGANDGPANASCTITNTENCRSWSLYGNRTSTIDNAAIVNALHTSAPSTGFVIVEIYHAHPHFTSLFTIGEFIPNPIQLRPFTIFPVPAAEPR
ncbi:MAG TPA: hypothetical protein ENN99_14935 [Chloroflexi bacterium]|nr:hypothetical protein [Chloroflexota bacterium]